jgi:hypothetical protein
VITHTETSARKHKPAPGAGVDRLPVERRKDHWHGEFRAMGSPCHVLSRASRADALAQLREVAREAWRIEAKFSRYLPGNIVDRINNARGKPVKWTTRRQTCWISRPCCTT